MIGGGRFGSVIGNRCGFRVEPQWLLNGDFLVVIGASGRPATQSVEIFSEEAFLFPHGLVLSQNINDESESDSVVIYHKVASSRPSRLVANFQIFRRLMKGKFYAYVL